MSGSPAWFASAAYLYVLRLDAIALAWEYLRRNMEYKADWRRYGQGRQGDERDRSHAGAWGLRWPGESRARRPHG